MIANIRTARARGSEITMRLEMNLLTTWNRMALPNRLDARVSRLWRLWLGLMLPELEAAREWREFGLGELLNEMDKQLLPDGADYEAATVTRP